MWDQEELYHLCLFYLHSVCPIEHPAESIIGLSKTECVHHEGLFRRVDDLELATRN